MKSQFVSDVSVFSAAWKSNKAKDVVSFVKRFEHVLLTDDKELPAKVLFTRIKELCSNVDSKFPKTLPLLVEMSRGQLYGGMQSKISIKPSRRDGSFSDSYWVIMTLIDMKNYFWTRKEASNEQEP